MDACLDAECHYTDLGVAGSDSVKIKKGFHEKFIGKKISAVTMMGSAPGTTNIFAKYCAERLDKVEKIELYGVLWKLGPESPVYVPSYDVLTLCAEYGQPSYQFIDGRLREVPPGSGEQTLVFPEPIGEVKCHYTGHPEPTTVSYVFKNKGVREVTWRVNLGDESEIAKSLMACGFGDTEPLEIEGIKVVSREFLKILIARNMRKNKEKITEPKEAYTIIRTAAEGEKGGRRLRYTVDRFGPHGSSISQSISAQLLAKGKIEAGVWFPEECIDVEEYLEEMKKKGFKFRVTIEEEV